ncbi:MAG: DUF3772 domain-containing protein [Pseudomonadota bacterium]
MRALWALLLALVLALPAWGQTAPNYGAWEDVANRAEAAVAAARASDEAFAVLRAEVEAFRQQFAQAQGINSARLDTLREQLAALGPPPGEGESEEAGIAARRAELNTQITELSAPGLRAGEAFRRADGIIGEIDAILRERRAEAMFSRGPSVLDLTIWASAARDLNGSLAKLFDGMGRAIDNGSVETAIRTNLPLIITFLVIALVFVLRGRFWLVRFGQRFETAGESAGRRLSGFLISLGQIIIPMIGLFALTRALLLTGLFAFWGEPLVAFIPAFGMAIFVARWLAGRLFPAGDGVTSPLTTPPERYLKAKLIVLGAGLTLAAFGMARELAEIERYSAQTRLAIYLPLIALAGYFTARIGYILTLHEAPAEAEEGAPSPSVLDRPVRLLSRFARLVGLAAPLLAVAGYLNAAEALVFPALETLTLFAVLALLFSVARDLFILFGGGRRADESLIPVLVDVALFVLSLPLLSLIWGATLTDLREVWVRIQAGVTLGETTISPSSFFVLIVVFVLGYTITRFIQSALRSSVLPKTRLDLGGQTAVVSGVGYVGIFIATMAAISTAGIDLSSLAFIAGALSVGIGFGLQNIVSNFISGIILLVERPISEGDWIEVGPNMGFVRDISVRSTRIETFDRTDVIVPNADLISGTVTNYTRGNTVGRVIVPVGVAYGTDTRKVEAILREIAEGHPMVALNPPPNVVFQGFGADSLDFEIRAILRDVLWVVIVKSEMNHAIAERFAAEGIEIPFAQRDVWIRNPEALQKRKVHDMESDVDESDEGSEADAPSDPAG